MRANIYDVIACIYHVPIQASRGLVIGGFLVYIAVKVPHPLPIPEMRQRQSHLNGVAILNPK